MTPPPLQSTPEAEEIWTGEICPRPCRLRLYFFVFTSPLGLGGYNTDTFSSKEALITKHKNSVFTYVCFKIQWILKLYRRYLSNCRSHIVLIEKRKWDLSRIDWLKMPFSHLKRCKLRSECEPSICESWPRSYFYTISINLLFSYCEKFTALILWEKRNRDGINPQ